MADNEFDISEHHERYVFAVQQRIIGRKITGITVSADAVRISLDDGGYLNLSVSGQEIHVEIPRIIEPKGPVSVM